MQARCNSGLEQGRAVEVVRNDQIIDLFGKQNQQGKLSDQMGSVRGRGESRRTPGILPSAKCHLLKGKENMCAAIFFNQKFCF